MHRLADAFAAARQLFARNLMAGDAVVAMICFPPIALSGGTVDASGDWVLPATLLMLACWWVPLFWRRSQPEIATIVVMVGHLLQLLLVSGPTGGNITVPIMAYALGRYAKNRAAAGQLIVVGVIAGVVGGLAWSLGMVGAAVGGVASSLGGASQPPIPTISTLTPIFLNVLILLSAWAFGLLNRQRRMSMDQLRERAEGLERERDQRAKLAAEEERTRIAREMHDVVAHSLSVIVVQADGASYAVAHGDPAKSAQLSAQALSTIGDTAREALADTRRLVAVLRAGSEGGAEYAPQAGLADLERLVEPIRQAGRPIDLVVTGDAVKLPRDADLAAYRVVQEALTNVIKHAGARASVEVGIAYEPDAVRVTVSDDGLGVSVLEDGRGHGIIGMRERVGAYGGTLRTGPRPGGGFVVTASIPLGMDVPVPGGGAAAPPRSTSPIERPTAKGTS